jgi:hypothetical protein
LEPHVLSPTPRLPDLEIERDRLIPLLPFITCKQHTFKLQLNRTDLI